MIAALLARPAFRYLCVGATCASANWALMLAIDDKRYLVSSIVTFVPVSTLGFVLHATWTFRERLRWRSWIAYLAGLLPNFPVALAMLAILRDGVGVPLWLSIPMVTVAMTIANFYVARWAIVSRALPLRVTVGERVGRSRSLTDARASSSGARSARAQSSGNQAAEARRQPLDEPRVA